MNIKFNLLEMSGYVRLRHILSGSIPTIDTFGIVTAENPQSDKLPDDENKRRNVELEAEIKRGNYGYQQIKGRYGNYENPYFINNINRQDVVELGIKWDQETIIWGEVSSDDKGKLRIYMIYCFKNNELVRNANLYLKGDTKDNYSEFKGRKFIVPFYDDDYEIEESKISMKYLTYKEDLPKDESVDILIEKIDNFRKRAVDEKRNLKSKWLARGNGRLKVYALRKKLKE